MLGEDSPITPDLEWMLLSGQVSDKVLIAALVNEQYLHVINFISSFLGDPQEARQAALQTLASVVLNAHRYRGDQDVRTWCGSLAIRSCQKYLRRQGFRRMLVKLHLSKAEERRPFSWLTERKLARGQELHGDTSEELGHARLEVERLVAQYRGQMRVLLSAQEIGLVGLAISLILLLGRAIPSPSPLPTYIKTVLVTRIVKVDPTATPVPPLIPLSIPSDAVSIYAEAGETLREIAGLTGISLDALRALNSLSPDNPLRAGQKVILGFGPLPLSLITPTAVTPAPTQPPLALQTDHDAIRQRVRTSSQNWHTLWAEFETVDYGPTDYVGRPLIKVWQVWYSQSFAALVLEGDRYGNLDHIWLAVKDRLYDYDLITTRHSVVDSGNLISFSQVGNFGQMLFPDHNLFQGDFTVLGMTDIAGRAALELEWPKMSAMVTGYIGHYWVDAQTGLILRSRKYSTDDGRQLTHDSFVDSIVYDVPFPNRLFDYLLPLPTRLAQDYRGTAMPTRSGLPLAEVTQAPGHQSLPHRTPPPDFDPSRSWLSFQWTAMSSLGASHNRADIFAGPYYLGSVAFGGPNDVICRRSPDGGRIAFTGGSQSDPGLPAPLRWFRLDNLAQVTTLLPQVVPGDLVFAPDSRHLALYACLRQDPWNDCGVYVVDTDTGASNLLLSGLVNAHSFTWRSDGRALAFVGYPRVVGEAGVWVLNPTTGEVLYNGPVSWDANSVGSVAPDSPTLSWDVPFPVSNLPDGISGCVEP